MLAMIMPQVLLGWGMLAGVVTALLIRRRWVVSQEEWSHLSPGQKSVVALRLVCGSAIVMLLLASAEYLDVYDVKNSIRSVAGLPDIYPDTRSSSQDGHEGSDFRG